MGIGSGRNQRRAILLAPDKAGCNSIRGCRIGVTVTTPRDTGHEGIERWHVLFELPEHQVTAIAANVVDGPGPRQVGFGLRRNGRAAFVPIAKNEFSRLNRQDALLSGILLRVPP